MEHDERRGGNEHDDHDDHGETQTGDETIEIVEIVDELLIEEISIDGMCGVY